ncbi:MAG: MBL fold metallo-hydrolase [Gordonia paraffinivorans]
MTAHLSRWTVGAATITAVHELDLEGVGPWLLPDVTPELVAGVPWLDPAASDPDGGIRVDVRSLVVEIGGSRIVVDTGVGNGKTRVNPAWNHLETAFLSAFAAAAGPPEAVDVVVNTHLHRDHVGWNTRWSAGDGSRPFHGRGTWWRGRSPTIGGPRPSTSTRSG